MDESGYMQDEDTHGAKTNHGFSKENLNMASSSFGSTLSKESFDKGGTKINSSTLKSRSSLSLSGRLISWHQAQMSSLKLNCFLLRI